MEKNLKLTNLSKNTTLVNEVEIAQSFSARSKGLLGRKSIAQGVCLWIHKCPSIHTFFMKFPIDVIFVNKNLKVTSVKIAVPAWRLSWGGFYADSCFELKAHSIANESVKAGDQLHVGA